MLILSIFAFIFTGMIAGLLAGLLGISGGVVTIPILVLMFNLLDINQTCLMQMAIGTSLASMVFNAISSTLAHNRKRGVMWGVIRRMAPGIVMGSILGAFVAKLLPSEILKVIFGVFECIVGIYFFRKGAPHEGEHRLPGRWLQGSLGFGIGGVSNILGIGGGIITVPTLMAFNVKPKKAVGTSAAAGLIISMMGASSYLYFGLRTDCGQPSHSVGYIYLPAFIAISVAALFCAPYGAKLAHILSPTILRRIFGCALLATGLLMIFI